MTTAHQISLPLGVIALMASATPASVGDYTLETRRVTSGFTWYYDLDLDGNGDPHAVYDDTLADRLYYSNGIAGTWGTPEFIHTTSDYGSTAVSLAVDSKGVSQVAYDSGMSGVDVFTYATNPGGAWSSSVVRTTSRWYSLDLSPADAPRVAYYYDYSGLNYAALVGGSWSHDVVDSTGGVTTYAGRHPDLVVDPADHAHIVYYDYTTDSIRYATNAYGPWQWQYVSLGVDSEHAELARAPDGTLWTVYRAGGRIWLARKTTTGWFPAPLTEAGSFDYMDVQVGPAGRVHVVYNDNATGTLKLAVQVPAGFRHYQIFEHPADGSGPVLRIFGDRLHVLAWTKPTQELFHLSGPLPLQAGDLNCDGEINAFDIDPFVLALTDPAGYEAAWPDCDRMLADINDDGKVDAFDIDPFVELLTG